MPWSPAARPRRQPRRAAAEDAPGAGCRQACVRGRSQPPLRKMHCWLAGLEPNAAALTALTGASAALLLLLLLGL